MRCGARGARTLTLVRKYDDLALADIAERPPRTFVEHVRIDGVGAEQHHAMLETLAICLDDRQFGARFFDLLGETPVADDAALARERVITEIRRDERPQERRQHMPEAAAKVARDRHL